MRVSKVISALIISGLLMPLQLPPYFISDALAEPSTVPSADPASMTSDTAVSAGAFQTGVTNSQDTIATMNELAAITGAVVPPAPIIEEEESTEDPNDSLGDPGDPIPGDEIDEAPPVEDEECPPDSEGLFPLGPEPDEELNPPSPLLPESFALVMPMPAEAEPAQPVVTAETEIPELAPPPPPEIEGPLPPTPVSSGIFMTPPVSVGPITGSIGIGISQPLDNPFVGGPPAPAPPIGGNPPIPTLVDFYNSLYLIVFGAPLPPVDTMPIVVAGEE